MQNNCCGQLAKFLFVEARFEIPTLGFGEALDQSAHGNPVVTRVHMFLEIVSLLSVPHLKKGKG